MIPFALLLALPILAACSATAPDPRSQITRAQLDAFAQPLILAELSGIGTAATMVQGSANGDVVTWRSADNTTLSLRDGVLVATRGLGDDLISAEVGNTMTALRGGAGEYYTKFHSYLDGEHQAQFRSFQCAISARRAETITIFGHQHFTSRIDETCHSPGLEVANSYWRAGGVMWKTKQWVSPAAGYLLTERLVR